MRTCIFCVLLLLAAESFAETPCAGTIGQLRGLLADPAFPLKWYETTMDDGKPLVLTFRERDGVLFLEFVKTGDGLWAEGVSVICRNGADLEARIAAEQIHVGPAANIPARFALLGGGQFLFTHVSVEKMQIAASGFSATFSSHP